MVRELVFSHEGLDVIFYEQDKSLKLYGIFPKRVSEELRKSKTDFNRLYCFVETEIQYTGENQESHGYKIMGGSPGYRLILKQLLDQTEKGNRKITLVYVDKLVGLEIESHYLFVKGVPVIKRWVTVKNNSNENVGLEHVYSAVINGINWGVFKEWDENFRLYIPYSSWVCEGQWKSGRLYDFGFQRTVGDWGGSTCVSISQTGSWSSSSVLPMAVLEDIQKNIVWFWQIEHNGSWHWEIGDFPLKDLYIYIGGPNEIKNHWWKNLKPGQSFTTVPVGIGVAEGGFQDAVKYLTSYRRKSCIRKHKDNCDLPVIFNDYMNCLHADPTTEKELPLIDRASKVGCEYFVIDAGWYSGLSERWSMAPSFGSWEENQDRFPGGLKKLFDKIREKGMIPGLWLEIEVIGKESPLKDKPDSWFMVRHGKKIIESGRYLLDFRNPEVVEHVTKVIDRLVNDYGIGYIKNDYNTTAEMGTELNADSFGDGLLEHNRAFLSWLDSIHSRYPDLVIENCGSGGMRMDYAMLSQCQLQSSSDQMNYFANPSIISGAMAACLPEQLAGWSYPLKNGDEEEAIFNMVNVMSGRIHLSGQLADISSERLEYVRKAISTYKSYRKEIPHMIPFYPAGTILAINQKNWHSFGLLHETEPRILLSVWRLKSDKDNFIIPLPFLKDKSPKIEQVFPDDRICHFDFDDSAACLNVELKSQLAARLFKINF